MAKRRRRGRFSLKEDRQLIQMAAASATLEEAAASLRTSVETIERKTERLGIKLKGKRPSATGQSSPVKTFTTKHGTVAKMNGAAIGAPVSGGSFGLPKFLAVIVDRQQQADNDGDYHGVSANLFGRESLNHNGRCIPP
jgi:hypothetical protein